MSLNEKRRPLRVALAALALLVWSACSGDRQDVAASRDAESIAASGSVSVDDARADGKPAEPLPAPVAEGEQRLQLDVEGRYGGRLVAALPNEPKTFNPVLASDEPSRAVLGLLTADLIHIDARSQETTAALARSWEISEDGRRMVVELRRGIRFSDGEPFDVDDALFTFEVALDPATASPQRDLLLVGGEPIRLEKLDSYSFAVHLATPYSVPERLFDGFAILPEHRLGEAYRAGRLTEAWGLSASPEEIVGLGPFRMVRHLPGERLELERNPHYFKVDRSGDRLPYLDRLVLLFVPNADTRRMRFAAGEIDLLELDPESFEALAEQDDAALRAIDGGAGLDYDMLFFNLNDLPGDAPAELRRKQRWFRERNFRRAVSAAIDREALVEIAFQGHATPLATHVTPGNRRWRNTAIEVPERSLDVAREHLRAAGFTWAEDGRLLDGDGAPVAFTLITNASSVSRSRMATLIQDDLVQLGMAVQAVPLEFRSLVERITGSFDYEACLLGLGPADADPNTDVNVWLSDGASRLWQLRREGDPAAWESEIDTLLRHQIGLRDQAARREIYDRIQEIVAAEMPAVFLVSPNILVGARGDLGNFSPAILFHPALWSAETLYWKAVGDAR